MTHDVRLIAFYLPQYHPIPENDAWWGAGFTEWRNVARARPNFGGHHQPQLPADLGFYDLRLAETREAQAKLARAHGIHAFCYYRYWFSGRELLERPLAEVVKSGAPDFPFCVCWANEHWSRAWDGRADQVLMPQSYGEADALAFIHGLLPTLGDPRYVRVDGRPLLLVYCASAIAGVREWTRTWRREAQRAGHPDLYLAQVHSVHETEPDPRVHGFDATVEFPPHWTRSNDLTDAVPQRRPGFRGAVLDYVSCAQDALARPRPPYTLLRGVMPGWDNTARGQDTSNVFVNAEPANYARWLAGAVAQARAWHRGEERLVFVNAWNEWAEGCHLEPDLRYGHAFLEATRRALDATAPRPG